METDADNKDAADNVTAYLQHMLCAARTLTATTKSEGVRMQDTLEDTTSTDYLLDSIASTLLEVVAVLHHPIDDLVPQPPAPFQHEWDPLDPDLLTRPYPMRRTDYLRRLLRALAPVAMEIAAQVLDTSSTTSYRECATILFGVWLPIAPQLLPGFTDGVEQGRLPFVFHEQSQQDETLLIRLEAAYHIARECWYTHR